MKTLLLGDISPTEVTAHLFESEDIKTLFTDTLSLFENKDLVVANLECAITEHDLEIKKKGPAIKAPINTAKVLRKVGIDCVGLSNNHVFDFGKKGIADTLDAILSAGLDYTGFGEDYEDSRKNYIFEKNGERICLIAVCEHEYSYALEDRMGSRPYDDFDTMEDIRKAKEIYDRVIVMYHGAKEHCQYPSPRVRKVCHVMAKNGADVVLCQHSHCIGTYEKVDGCHILYGQGNFHFVKPNDRETWHTAFAVCYDTDSHAIEFVPVRALEYGISLAKGDDKNAIMAKFDARNASLVDGTWLDGWREFCEANKEAYISVVRKACVDGCDEKDLEKFAHYLDCEAHTDVWRELFKTYNATNEK